MKRPTPNAAGALASLTILIPLAFAASCGGGDFVFGGDDGDNPTKVTFTGNLNTVTPVTSRDIVVFVYNIDDNSDRCPCPANPCPDSSSCVNLGKTAVLESGETEFTISDLEPGAFGVVFLLDNSGVNADGEINPGDPIAVLDDTDCQLDDINGKITATLKDVDIDFEASPSDPTTTLPGSDQCSEGNPPAPGRARADLIRLTTTVTTK